MDAAAVTRSDILGGLKTYYSRVAMAVTSAESDWFTPSNAVSGWKTALKTYAGILARMEPSGDLGAPAFGSQSAHEFWMSNARNVSNGLSNIMETMGFSRFQWNNFWDQVVVKTGTDIKTTATKAVDSALPHTYAILALVVVGLIAVAVIKVT